MKYDTHCWRCWWMTDVTLLHTEPSTDRPFHYLRRQTFGIEHAHNPAVHIVTENVVDIVTAGKGKMFDIFIFCSFVSHFWVLMDRFHAITQCIWWNDKLQCLTLWKDSVFCHLSLNLGTICVGHGTNLMLHFCTLVLPLQPSKEESNSHGVMAACIDRYI